MDNCQQHRSASRKALNAAGIAFIALLTWALLADNARADPTDSDWHFSMPLYLTAGAYFSSANAAANIVSSVNTTAEVLLSSPTQRYDAALFVDYRLSPDAAFDGTVNAGAFVKAYAGRWDTTVFVFSHHAPGVASHWAVAGRLRYVVARKHKFGIEFLTALQDSSSRNLSLGYYGQITEALAVNVVAGASITSSSQRSARTELVWQFN